jgi:glucose/arabinose dehydrogenase
MKKFRDVCRVVVLRGGIKALIIISLMLVQTGCQPKPDIAVGIALVAEGLNHPVAVAVPDDGSNRLFIVDQIGLIYVVNASGTLEAQPYLDVTGKMVTLSTSYDERGLLGLAFHPDFKNNRRFFVFYNVPLKAGDPQDFDCRVRVSEFLAQPGGQNAADPDSEQVLLEVLKPSSNHNGGEIAFGPDGYLYIGIGDGGGANDVGTGHTEGLGNGQDLNKLLGKILRYDVSTPGTAQIPPDNPFVSDPDIQPAIYAYGFRNPWRFSFDAGGEQRLFCTDVGQNLIEEVDIITKGGNYGWNIKEGTLCFDPQNPGSPLAQCPAIGAREEALIDPVIEYSHSGRGAAIVGKAIAGGFVYRGKAIPALIGKYIFADWSGSFASPDGKLFIADEQQDKTWKVKEAGIAGQRNNRLNSFVLGVGQGLDKEAYVLTATTTGPRGSTGQVWKLVMASQ